MFKRLQEENYWAESEKTLLVRNTLRNFPSFDGRKDMTINGL